MQEITVYDIDDNALVDLVQWDSNVKIFVKEDGIDAAYNVHFFNCKSTDAMVMESAYSNGILSTVIPNDLLMDSHPITGYIYVEKNDEHKSVYCFRLVVRKRPKPSNYIYVDQKEYITFDKILQEAQKYANESKDYSEKAKLAETNASTYADTASQKATDASSSAVAAKASETASKESETNAAVSEKNAYDKADEASVSANTATTKATEASDSATLAKYHSEQSKNSSDLSKTYLEKVEQAGNEAVDKIQNALDISAPNFIVDLSTGHLMYSGERFAFLVNKAGHLEWGLIV